MRTTLIIIILLIAINSNAQKNKRGSNQYLLEGNLIFNHKGFGGQIAGGIHTRWYIDEWVRFSLEYLQTELTAKDAQNFDRDNISFPIKLYTFSATYNNTIIQFPKKTRVRNMYSYLTIDGGLGGLVGYETINNNKYKLPTGEEIIDKSKLVYGAVGRLEAELFFGLDYTTIFAAIEQKYFINSDTGKTRSTLHFGLRYWFQN